MLLRCLAAALGGLVLAAGFEPVGLAVLLPVGVASLVLCVRGLSVPRGCLVGLVFGIAHFGALIWWMRAVNDAAYLGLAGFQALFLACLGGALAMLGRLPAWPVWCAVAWVAVEVWRGAWPFSGFTWGRLAFGTVETVWAPGLPWLGSTGVSLLVAVTGTWIAWVLLGGWRRPRPLALGTIVVAAATLVPVWAPYAPTTDGTARVAAVQPDVPGDGTDVVAHFREITDATADLTVDLAAEEPAPDVVLWPENSTAVDPFADERTNADIARASAAIGVPILVGAMVDGPREDEVLNQSIVWRPDTGAADRYAKRHPVPFGEYIPFRQYLPTTCCRLDEVPRDMVAGTRVEPLPVGDLRVGAAICFDVSYDDVMLGQASRGAQLLTVQTSNAMFIHTAQIDQQFEITRMRAIETGRWVVVAAINGVSGIIAPDGTVRATAEPRTRDVVAGTVGLGTGRTPAVVMGPWTGRAATAAALLATAVAWLTYRRTRRIHTPDEQEST